MTDNGPLSVPRPGKKSLLDSRASPPAYRTTPEPGVHEGDHVSVSATNTAGGLTQVQDRRRSRQGCRRGSSAGDYFQGIVYACIGISDRRVAICSQTEQLRSP
jgi:hypothetical protein